MAYTNEVVIRHRKGWVPVDFRELWEFRELMFFLAWRDIKVKYKQSALGVAWVVFRPVIAMAIFSVLFGMMAKIPSEGAPYAIFVFLGLLPWTYFSSSVSASTASLVGSANLVSKVYFPRIFVPISAGVANLLDFFVSLSVLAAMMLYYKIAPGTGILLLPLLTVALFIATLGPGLLFSALNVRYRDIGQIIPFLVQIWMFVTPVIYPVSFIPEKYRLLAYLNPMAGIVEAFRFCILENKDIDLTGLAVSLLVSLGLFLLGLFYFKRVDRTFADVI